MKDKEDDILVTAETLLPTRHGLFNVCAFGDEVCSDHLFLRYGDIRSVEAPLVRVHSECVTSEVFGSLKCDCVHQLNDSLDIIRQAGAGIVIYLRQEGRGIGLFKKMEAYKLQEEGYNTIDANLELDLPVDKRDYRLACLILEKKGISSIRLITGNDDKVAQLRRYGINVAEVVRTASHYNSINDAYIDTKITRLGHKYLNHDKSPIAH